MENPVIVAMGVGIYLQTERLYLLPLTDEHLQLAAHHWNLLEEQYALNASHFEVGDDLARALVIKRINLYHDPSNWLWHTYWVMIARSSMCTVGLVGFKGPPEQDGAVELGFTTHPAERKRGYMTEAVAALSKWAFTEGGVQAVRAETLKGNIASQRVLIKNGFTQVGSTENSFWWQISQQNRDRH